MQASLCRDSTPRLWTMALPEWALKAVLRPAQLLRAAPCFLFLAALTAMLLRHPDAQLYEIDRIAFGLLLAAIVGRALVQRRHIFFVERASWPMMGLTLLAVSSVAGQPFHAETWSLLASKFLVPFALFHLAGLVFTEEERLRKFETFGLLVLAYLIFTAIVFLFGLHSLIFPRFILDPSLGFHADRARGPLLQAVSNGVSLNMLALLAVHAYRRRSVRGAKMAVLLGALPLAILATMTRAVWFSFAATIVALIFFTWNKRQRRVYLAILTTAAAVLLLLMSSTELGSVLKDRLRESGPVEYRQAVYAGGWDMFLQHPWTGWGFHQMPAELPRHVSGYGEKVLYPHNTYLELLVELGIPGLALQLWLMWELWRLRRGSIPPCEQKGFLSSDFHRLWALMLAVYWVNAIAVVMSYQFVNGLLFTMAGMLAAQQRRARAVQQC